jgi:putative transposase
MDRKPYPSDLSDAQWKRLQSVFPPPINGRSGRPRRHELREVVNALLYQARTGCSWRSLPHEFPPWGVVWEHFRRWRDNGTLELLHNALRTQDRHRSGRSIAPSAAILDSQSVKTTEKGVQKASTRPRK